MKADVAVLIPAYNEEKTLAEILTKVLALPFVAEVIVVDDGSADRTLEIARSFADPRMKVFTQKNAGKSAAIRQAVSQATAPICIVQDADLEYDPEEIAGVVEPIQKDQADVVYGSRFMVKKASRVLYYYHYVANKSLTALSNMLTNLNMTDIETGYKAMRTPILKRLPFTSSGFGLEIEITALVGQLGVRVYEVPISYYGRTYEEGKKIGMKDGIAAILYIFWYNLFAQHLSTKTRTCLRLVRQDLAALQAAPKVAESAPSLPATSSSRKTKATGRPAAQKNTRKLRS